MTLRSTSKLCVSSSRGLGFAEGRGNTAFTAGGFGVFAMVNSSVICIPLLREKVRFRGMRGTVDHSEKRSRCQ